jgi:hypothetical protein
MTKHNLCTLCGTHYNKVSGYEVFLFPQELGDLSKSGGSLLSTEKKPVDERIRTDVNLADQQNAIANRRELPAGGHGLNADEQDLLDDTRDKGKKKMSSESVGGGKRGSKQVFTEEELQGVSL